MHEKEERNENGWAVEQERLKKRIYRLGVNRSYRGFEIALEAAFLLRRDESLKECMKRVYIDAAIRNRTSKENVERNIRTLIQTVWIYGDREELEEMAGRKLEKPPTCQEFIEMLADCMKKKKSSVIG